MQINLIYQQPSFKKIELSPQESKTSRGYLKYALSDKTNKKYDYELLDLFTPHFNKEVEEKKFSTGRARKDFVTNLYVKFFKTLDSIKESEGEFSDFLDEINLFIDDFTEREFEKDVSILSDYNFSSVQKDAQSLYEYLRIPKDEFLELSQKFPILQNITANVLKKEVPQRAARFGFTENEYINILARNPKILLRTEPDLADFAKEIMEILNIADMETFREAIKLNPNLFTYTNLAQSIKDLSEFLGVSECRVKKAMRLFPQVATTKLEHAKMNFYAMKDYLKVERDAMVDIVLLSPIIISKGYNANKKNIEDIAELLGVLPESYIKMANESPTIYRNTRVRVEKIINVIKEALNVTSEEAIEYIRNDLSILKNSHARLKARNSANQKTFEDELNINNETYRELLSDNPWLMYHKNEMIRKNIKDARDFFGIDNETYKNMLLKNIYIIMHSIDVIDKRIFNASNYLKISYNELKDLCLIEPELATKPLRFYQNDIPSISEYLDIKENEYIKQGMLNPVLLARKPADIEELIERMDYYNLVFADEKIDITNKLLNSEDVFFAEIFAGIVAKSLLLQKDSSFNPLEAIAKQGKRLLDFDLPKHELTSKFADYVDDLFKKNNLTNKCKAVIKHL